MTIQLIHNKIETPLEPGWSKISHNKGYVDSHGASVSPTSDGKKYKVLAVQAKYYSAAEVFGAVLAVIFSLGLALIAHTIKDMLCHKKKAVKLFVESCLNDDDTLLKPQAIPEQSGHLPEGIKTSKYILSHIAKTQQQVLEASTAQTVNEEKSTNSIPSKTTVGSPLTKFQHFHKEVFTAPKGGLCAWAIHRMEYYELGERTKVAYISSRIIKRIIAIAMPLFALLDAICFFAKVLFKAAILRFGEARADLMSCGKSLGIFFGSLIATPAAIHDPLRVYRTEESWGKVMDRQMHQRIKNDYASRLANSNEKENIDLLKDAINEQCGNIIADPQIKIALQEVLQKITEKDLVDVDPQVKLSIGEVLQKIDEKNLVFANPQVKITLEETLAKINKKDLLIADPQVVIEMQKILKAMDESDQTIVDPQVEKAMQEILQKINEKGLNNYSSVIVDNYMHLFGHLSVGIWRKKIALTPEAHKNFVDLAERICLLRNDEVRLQLTDILLISLKDNGEAFNRWQAIAKGTVVNKIIRKLPTHAHLPLFVASQLGLQDAFVEKISKICNSAFKDKLINIELITFLINLHSADVNNSIKEEIITQIYDNQATTEYIPAQSERSRNAMKIFTTLLTIDDTKLIQDCLSIGKEAGNSDAVLKKLFNEIFDLELDDNELKMLLDPKLLRAPWAWLRFHTRLTELTGSERVNALEANRKCLKWFVEGTYQQHRHDEDKNPHLKAIFEKFPDLRQAWVKSPARKVADLVPQADDTFKEFDIIDTQDPSDILLIGVEAHQCMNLFGRLYRVKGLLGFLMDGKTHVIVVKNAKGEIRGEAELQLMWDKQNDRPVLLLEEICTAAGSGTKEENDVNLALHAYAKERAQALKLDLVGHYEGSEGNFNYNVPRPEEYTNYNGSVSSLGTSSPIEYVNCYLDILKGPYTVKGTNVLARAYQAERPEVVPDETPNPGQLETDSSDHDEPPTDMQTRLQNYIFFEGGLSLNRLPFLTAFLATDDATERANQISLLAKHKKEIKNSKAKKVQDGMAAFHFGFQQLCLQLFEENQARPQKRHLTNILNALIKNEVPFSSPELIADCQSLMAYIDSNKPTGEQIRQWLKQHWIESKHLDLAQWQIEIAGKALSATDASAIKPLNEELKATRKAVQINLSQNSDEEIEQAGLVDLQECCMQLIVEQKPEQRKVILDRFWALVRNHGPVLLPFSNKESSYQDLPTNSTRHRNGELRSFR